MKGLIYSIIVAVPVLIIGTTVYLTRNWPATSPTTMVTWFLAWLISMLLVAVLYVKLMPRSKWSDDDDSDTTEQHQNSKKRD